MKQTVLSLLPPNHPWADRIHYYKTIHSTNTCAKELARAGAPEGTVVLAAHQTGGRGRLGRSFSSPAGAGVYLSVILRPNCPPEQLMHLTCAAGVAAADAVEKAAGFRPGIKWTNDLVADKRKLGGILTELSVSAQTGLVEYAVVGIGINCLQQLPDFPEDIRPMACSLSMITGAAISPALTAARLTESVHHMTGQLLCQKSALMNRFRQDCVTVGNPVCVVRGDAVRHGAALEIDEDGGLLVEYADGSRETVTSGEVSIRGMYGYL